MSEAIVIKSRLDAHKSMLAYWMGLVEETEKEYEYKCVEEVRKAVLDSCNHTWKQLRSSCREESFSFARFIFGYHLDRCGVRKDRIARELNRSVPTVFYYPENYVSETSKQFKSLAEKVEKKLCV